MVMKMMMMVTNKRQVLWFNYVKTNPQYILWDDHDYDDDDGDDTDEGVYDSGAGCL